MASSEEAEGKEVEEEEEKKEEGEVQKKEFRRGWNKCKDMIASFLTAKRKEEEKEKRGRKSDKRHRT